MKILDENLAFIIKTSPISVGNCLGHSRDTGGPSQQELEARALVQLCCVFVRPWAGHLAFLVSNCIIYKLRELWFWYLLFLTFSNLLMYPWYDFRAGFLPSLNSLFSHVLKPISKVNQSGREKQNCFSAFQFSKGNQEGKDQGSGSDFNWYLDIGKSLPLSEP